MFIARFVSCFRSIGAVCERTLNRLYDSLYCLGDNLRCINLICYLLNINHQITLSNEKQRNSAYFGVPSYKSGLQTLPTMIDSNLGYIIVSRLDLKKT